MVSGSNSVKKNKDGYPYFCFLLVYIVALIPILTDMSVDNAITMLMIPTMLINAYLNVACMTIPKKYPEQFEKRAVRFPLWLYNVCSSFGRGLCLGHRCDPVQRPDGS